MASSRPRSPSAGDVDGEARLRSALGDEVGNRRVVFDDEDAASRPLPLR